MRRRLFRFGLIVGMLGLWGGQVQATPRVPEQLTRKPLAFLVVVDSSDAKQLAAEKNVAKVIVQLRQKYPGLTKKTLPVFAYHVNVPDERAYCEKHLGVHKKDLVYIGIATRRGDDVGEILYHASNIQDPQKEGFQLFRHACLALGLNPGVLDVHKASTPSQTLVTENGGGRLAFSGLFLTDADGKPHEVFKSSDNGVCFSLFVQNLTLDKSHAHAIELTLLNPKGDVYGRPLGGTLVLNPGEQCMSYEVLSKVDKDHNNGFVIKDHDLGANPGQYKVRVTIDGKVVDEKPFTIEADAASVGAGDQLGVLQCFVGDDHAQPRTEFHKQDTGAFVFVVLRNLLPNLDDQRHTLEVRCLDKSGKPLGRVLGGDFVVKKGEDLGTREFPADNDESGVNGILIRQGAIPPGDYEYQVKIDDKVVKDLPFSVEP